MTRLERTRQEPHGLGEIKAIPSEMYVFFLAPRALWTMAYRGVIDLCVCVCVGLGTPARIGVTIRGLGGAG